MKELAILWWHKQSDWRCVAAEGVAGLELRTECRGELVLSETLKDMTTLVERSRELKAKLEAGAIPRGPRD